MYIKIVENKETENDFYINVIKEIYKNDVNYISPILQELKDIFNPKHNPFFKHGEAVLYVAYNNNKKPIGRIAVFVNELKKIIDDVATGGVGFFESINDYKVAKILFDTAKIWLQNKNCFAMQGPINFGENDKFWGLLIDGFSSPSMSMNYNPTYYQPFFEEYGFKKEYDQFTNLIDFRKPVPERFAKIADWIMKKPGYRFGKFEKNNFDKYAKQFIEIYNDAWQDFKNFVPLDFAVTKESFRQMKSIVDEKIIWFAYFNDEPIGFILALPDINPILKKLNGKLNLINKLRFLYYQKTMRLDKIRMIIMGCKQKFQNKGVESALIRSVQLELLKENKIHFVELAWVGDFNTKMIAIHEATGAQRDKVHRTYICKF